MTYSDPKNKTIQELEEELIQVWISHYKPYSDEHYTHVDQCDTFDKMVLKFANDDFYNLHYVAKEYIKIKNTLNI